MVVVGGCAADRLGQWSVSDSPGESSAEPQLSEIPPSRIPPFNRSPSSRARSRFARHRRRRWPSTCRSPRNQAWGDTGIDVVAKEPLTIRADGTISVGRSAKGNYDDQTQVGPEGTFLYSEKVFKRDFPLASAGSGPAPCFCLIGRIGDSQPFFIGRGRSWKPTETGRLYLGINDFDVSDNTGAFIAHIENRRPFNQSLTKILCRST